MENKLTRWVYEHSPVVLQNAFATAYGLQKRLQRYNGSYYRYFKSFFDECRHWSHTELRAYQDERLAEVVRHAYDHVPFYRERMDGLKLRPQDIRKVDDLPKLPYLTKDDIRRAGEQLLADDYPRKKMVGGTTSGSTGFPLMVYCSRRAIEMEYAFHWSRRRPGVKRGERYASFTGLQIVRSNSLKPPFWRINLAANQRCYSVFHMSERTIPFYLDDLQKHPCAWFEGYPTPIYLLARYVIDHGYRFTSYPRAVFTTSEKLRDEHRQVIEEAFQTRVYDQYGQHEKTSSITEYECGHLHDDMSYAVTELVPMEKQENATVCEVIGTGLYNEAMVLLRYQVGDMGLNHYDMTGGGSYKYKFGASEVTICRHVKSSPLLMLGRKVAKSCFRLSKRIACSLSSKT